MVLVFETRGSVAEIFNAAKKAGLELLIEVEDEFEADDDFQKATKAPAAVPGFIHVALGSLGAVQGMRNLWETWTRGEPLPRGLGGYGSGLASLFTHLADVRPWSAEDRVRSTGLVEAIEERIALGIREVPIEVELWFYASEERRAESESALASLIAAAGGTVSRVATYAQFGYHAVAARLPVDALSSVVAQGADSIQLLRSDDVFVVRPGGQTVMPPTDAIPSEEVMAAYAPVSGPPTVALLDGLPAVNHIRLDGRVIVSDPDGLDDGTYEARLRKHGTQMASLIVWGDLADAGRPLSHPILARPILKPDPLTQRLDEAVPDGTLMPDLMVRAFADVRRDSPSIRIVNLSVCDPHAPFDAIPSAWARAIDWLAAQHEMLVLVSAGNYSDLDIDVQRATFSGGSDADRRRWTLGALATQALSRRLLTPAEAINAVTVGALHSDSAGSYMPAGLVDPLGGAPIPSPISAIGRGFRRSVKPDVHAPGGRQLFSVDMTRASTTRLVAARSTLAPGLRAASPTAADPTRGEVHTRGTSGATALTTRRAAMLLDILEALRAGVPGFADRHLAPAVKALLVHGTEWPDVALIDDVPNGLPPDRLLAYGWLATDHSLGCPPHRATVLVVGDLGSHEEADVVVPLPPSLGGAVGRRRITATAAWMSPTNWRNRQYRRAKLTFATPSGALQPVLTSAQMDLRRSQRGTVQHQIFEGSGAVPITRGDEIRLTVQCMEQAGGLGGARVPYAVAVSLEVAESLNVDVYAEVAARVQQPVRAIARA